MTNPTPLTPEEFGYFLSDYVDSGKYKACNCAACEMLPGLLTTLSTVQRERDALIKKVTRVQTLINGYKGRQRGGISGHIQIMLYALDAAMTDECVKNSPSTET